MPVTEAKQRFTELVKGVKEDYSRYVITRNGEDAAVVISIEEYEGLLETLDILAHKAEVRGITEGSHQVRSGQTVSLSSFVEKKTRAAKTRRSSN